MLSCCSAYMLLWATQQTEAAERHRMADSEQSAVARLWLRAGVPHWLGCRARSGLREGQPGEPGCWRFATGCPPEGSRKSTEEPVAARMGRVTRWIFQHLGYVHY